MTTFYKVLDQDGRPWHGGTGTWHLPNGNRPGKWMPVIDRVIPCQSGYHLCTIDQLPAWLGSVVFVAEGRGAHVEQSDKHVFGQARLLSRTVWDDRAARLFAADCAERVLPIFEKHRPGDDRPHRAIEVARRFADGLASREEMAAARTAAEAAARTAAEAAAEAAAGTAAEAAAGTAAEAAARTAVWTAARTAAWTAAWDAARTAAEDAAWAAARDAERERQGARLNFYLNGQDD